MVTPVSRKISVKFSVANPLRKSLFWDKTLGIETDTRLYELEDGDNTEEGEEAESLSFTTQPSRHLSKISLRGSSPKLISLIIREPQWSARCLE